MPLKFGDEESIRIRDSRENRKRPRRIHAEERHTLQIRKMHELYGVTQGRLCKDCTFFLRKTWASTDYFKCRLFGDTNGPATDWRANYEACGKFKQQGVQG